MTRSLHTAATASPSRHPRLRTVALPAEHGSWGLVLEPLALGLLVAPSWAGAALALGAFAAFLARHPLKLAWAGRQQRPFAPRAAMALRVAAGYIAVACVGGLLALALASWLVVLPLLLALPFLLVVAVYDTRGQGRAGTAQLAAPVAISAVAACIALAGSVAFMPALAVWGVLVARGVPSVLYVRARLRLERDRGQHTAHAVVLLAHLTALALALLLAGQGMLPWTAPLALLLLLARAAVGLSRYRRLRSTQAIGFSELGFGVLTVLLVALGYRFLG